MHEFIIILMGIFKCLLLLMIHTFFWLLPSSSTASYVYGSLSDVYCLKTLKDSLEDPLNYLNSSWIFNEDTEAVFICTFNGVECWHPDENKVLNLQLSGMGLKGEFPKGLENCTSMSGLDLSSNQISGPIPSDISKRLSYITKLDLSSNGFSGEIPISLSNCQFLNILKLDNNRLSGQIPPQLGSLNRLKTFSVTNNLLSGQIPTFSNRIIPASSYANNPGLCGKPLDVCRGRNKEPLSIDREIVIFGLVVYFVVTVLSSWCWYWLLFAKIKTKTPNNQTTSTRQRASRETRLPSILPS